jgi:hypothetical protein
MIENYSHTSFFCSLYRKQTNSEAAFAYREANGMITDSESDVASGILKL